ncbi:MAG: UbiX family flavin prenyltransferase [Clostridiales Family XIII bacterium]|nr:UbiX family flavin prenyltransferase [Clostridiales Family XIII bacterium]
MAKQIVIGISGASGAAYGIRLLEELGRAGAETHLVASRWGEYTIGQETELSPEAVKALAAHVYRPDDMAAPISSGSFPLDAMAVVPCSMKTLAGIASGFSEDLIMRAADVCLKERRPLILAVRETPLSKIHIENMLRATEAGAICMPPVPALYTRPESIGEIVTQSVFRIMEKLGVAPAPGSGIKRWGSG